MTPRDRFSQMFSRWRAEADAWRARLRGDSPQRALMLQLARPNLGPTPQPLRRILEPVVAAAAALALLTLLGLGIASFTMFLLAGALVYAILSRVFGLELDLQAPLGNM